MDVEAMAGKRVRYKGAEVVVRAAKKGAFTDVDIALFSAGAEASLVLAPIAAEEGAVVIDNSSAWRMDPNVPLVVPKSIRTPWTAIRASSRIRTAPPSRCSSPASRSTSLTG
jgi:hypothetical protein